MGQEIEKFQFTEKDEETFRQKLREETKLLKKWFDQREFEFIEKPNVGLEVEAWLIDNNHMPLPENDEFIRIANDKDIVHELSQFNFELNVEPNSLSNSCLKKFSDNLKSTWSTCMSAAKDLSASTLLVGILPMIREEMLDMKYMSKSNRYRALNDQLYRMRSGKPIDVKINGRDELRYQSSHIMLEAAATSIQIHLQINQEESKRAYNASQIISAPIVAASANSPFLFGNRLWDESRIPVFEQAISVASFRDKKGVDVGRVTFGTGYVRHSLLEFFLENMNSYPILIPTLFEDSSEKMNHLRLQNGTLWRWNRPILGFSGGKPHLRIEHRVMSSGPSIEDIVANMALYLGLTYFYMYEEKAPEESMTFTDCKNNFYTAAKDGLNAKLRWFGKDINVQELLLKELLPNAKQGLERAGIDKAEIEYYCNEVLHQRILKGQNGANWQKSFVECHGPDFQSMSQKYLENQLTEKPVHLWEI